MTGKFDPNRFDCCLVCGAPMDGPGKPVTPLRARQMRATLAAEGLSDRQTKRRASLEYQAPGFAEWLEQNEAFGFACLNEPCACR